MKEIVLKTLSVGNPKNFSWNGILEASAIEKRKVTSCFLSKNGFHGDEVASPEFHGGPDRAVCLYPFEHYQKWSREFQIEFNPPAFGENICVSGMIEADVYIGDIYRFGETVIQISQGRVPCAKISKFNNEPGLLKRVFDSCLTGYFFRVLEEGEVGIDSSLTLLERPQSKVTIKEANFVLFHDQTNKQAISKILDVSELADAWQQKFLEMLKKV
jgi:MOSC domain-containing protein YiiM